MDLVWIIQCLIGAALALGAHLYNEMKKKVDKTQEDFLEYRTHVAEKYVSNDQLTKSIDNLNKTIDNVASTVGRIETRLNNQADRNM